MARRQGSHGDRPLLSSFRPPSAPKLNVQRSLSRENIAIHFSAMGKEEDQEEEGICEPLDLPSDAVTNSQGVVTALEASEDLVLEEDTEMKSVSNVVVKSLSAMSGQQNANKQEHGFTCSASAEPTKGTGSSSGSANSSPSKSMSLPSMDKSFINLMKSLSADLEPREGVPAPPPLRHRQLMKNLVKSLSTDPTPDPTGSNRSSDSRLNLQLFKQFTQPRPTTSTGDSKTAPSSPLTSPDNRSFSFKVSEVEARIEDTKRRLSEAISDPLHLISKFIGDDSSSIYRPKPLSSSATELTSFSTLNDHVENNNNYSIKEEEGDLDGEGVTPEAAELASTAESKTAKPCASSLGLDKCSMSALAKQDDEEFCELYNEDFEFSLDTEGQVGHAEDTKTGSSASKPASPSTNTFSEDEMELVSACSIPHKTLLALTIITYGYFILPLPTYLGGMLLGVALGFILAIGAVWLTGPKLPGIRRLRAPKDLWNVAQLDIKEPGIFKVGFVSKTSLLYRKEMIGLAHFDTRVGMTFQYLEEEDIPL